MLTRVNQIYLKTAQPTKLKTWLDGGAQALPISLREQTAKGKKKNDFSLCQSFIHNSQQPIKNPCFPRRLGENRSMTTREKAQHRVALYFSTAGLGTCVSLVAQVKILPANVGDVGWEGLLKKEMATHSRTLSWEIPQTEVSGGLESMGLQKSRTQLRD